MLALQVLVPLRALLDDSDVRQRFGWSMYANETHYPAVSLDLADGGTRSVPFASVVARRRPEVDYATELPPYLCDRYPQARAVRLRFDSPEPVVRPCR